MPAARHLRALVALVLAFLMVAAAPASVAAPGGVRVAAVDNTVVIYDVFGQRIDAHDGDLLQTADGLIYLYGTAYGCGYRLLTAGTAYCGVRVYSTRDLRTFTPAGGVGGSYAFDHLSPDWQGLCAPPAYGCFRPHVVQRPTDGVFVMWVNVHGSDGYRVLTSTSPGGPFVDTGITPTLAVQPPVGALRYGDMDLTVGPDGTGWVTYTAIWPTGNEHQIVVEKLDATLTTGTGEHVVLDTMAGVEMVEAPALFLAPTGMWHVLYSNPARPYQTTGTGIVNAPSPLGPWTWPRVFNSTSCVGQPTGAWALRGPSGATTWVWGSDRWVSGDSNQAKANNYYGPVTFDALGGTAIDAGRCVGNWSLQ